MILRKKPDYKWVILAICFLMEFVCLGFCSSNPGLYTAAVTEALNIKRSIFSISTSIRYVAQVIVSLFFGTFIHRLGIRKTVCLGLAALVGSVFIRGVATNVLHFYIGSALWGFGIVLSGGTMASTIVRRWFHKDIGKYTGIVMSANGIGGAIAAQIITPIINNGQVFGYRKAYLLSGIIALAISIVVLLFLREQPADGPVIPGEGNKKDTPPVWHGMEYAAIKKKPCFYVAAVLILLTGISLQSIGGISIIYMQDIGFHAGFIAATATVSSLILTVSKFFVGHIYDRRGLKTALVMCQIAAIISFALNGVLRNTTVGMVLAMAAVILSSLAMPLETIIIPLLSNELFGDASYVKVLGVFTAMNSLGLCLGSPLSDLYYDIFGTYVPCFWFFTGLMIAVVVAFQFVLRSAQKNKECLIAEENVPTD